MPCEEVIPGLAYRNDTFGGLYEVEDVVDDLTGYERTHEIGKSAVLYTQMDDGEIFRAGTRMSRTLEDFTANFSLANLLDETE